MQQNLNKNWNHIKNMVLAILQNCTVIVLEANLDEPDYL